jgi:hypothetical protein
MIEVGINLTKCSAQKYKSDEMVHSNTLAKDPPEEIMSICRFHIQSKDLRLTGTENN